VFGKLEKKRNKRRRKKKKTTHLLTFSARKPLEGLLSRACRVDRPSTAAAQYG
jgi:hypothetical protein